MWLNPQFSADLAIFTEEIHNRKLPFLWNVIIEIKTGNKK